MDIIDGFCKDDQSRMIFEHLFGTFSLSNNFSHKNVGKIASLTFFITAQDFHR